MSAIRGTMPIKGRALPAAITAMNVHQEAAALPVTIAMCLKIISARRAPANQDRQKLEMRNLRLSVPLAARRASTSKIRYIVLPLRLDTRSIKMERY